MTPLDTVIAALEGCIDRWETPLDDDLSNLRKALKQLREAGGWRLIPKDDDEAIALGLDHMTCWPPQDTDLHLAWKDHRGEWEYKTGWWGSTKGGWIDGSARYWMPVSPPTEEI
jgi:hypothetical protein